MKLKEELIEIAEEANALIKSRTQKWFNKFESKLSGKLLKAAKKGKFYYVNGYFFWSLPFDRENREKLVEEWCMKNSLKFTPSDSYFGTGFMISWD